jgi:uncharacterized protein (UPF0548 family)
MSRWVERGIDDDRPKRRTMVSLRRPSTDTMREFLTSQSKLGFTYKAVGATASLPPVGYMVNHTRIKLGQGEEVFTRAKDALGRWDQFSLGWLEAWSPRTPIQKGEVVAVIARNLGLWWLNACRIVYVVDETGSVSRYGFANGTLPDHAGTGEERFLVEWDRTSGEVWYDILAFSRPHFFLIQLGYPYMRRVQRRFGRQSAAAMLRAVGNEAGERQNIKH